MDLAELDITPEGSVSTLSPDFVVVDGVPRENGDGDEQGWPNSLSAVRASNPDGRSDMAAVTPPSIVSTCSTDVPGVPNVIVVCKRLSVERDAMLVERSNMLSVLKLVVKQLIDTSLSHGGMLDDVHGPLLQFFTIIENMLYHGIKSRARKGLLWGNDRYDCWTILEQFAVHVPTSTDILASIREMSNVRTSLGKVRAWLRLAMMQKTLAGYFGRLLELRDKLLTEIYEPRAIMMNDEAIVVSGLLVGLNIIDCNMVLKDDDDLDRPLGVIDYSLYLKEILSQPVAEEESQSAKMVTALIDQKNYMEELNRHLTTTIGNLNQKINALQAETILMREELTTANSNLLQQQHENSMLRTENSALLDGHRRQMLTAQQDIEVERETYQQSRQSLDALYQDVKKKLQDEIQMRLDVEKELELQIGMKQEVEVAARLLEKDGHEKQEIVASLRKQLEDVKNINIDMSTRLQTVESSLQHKVDMVSRLEQKTNQMAATIHDMEDGLKQSQIEKNSSNETIRKLGQQLADKDAKRLALETDLKIEREWRATLQKNLDQEKAKSAKLQTDIHRLEEVKKEFEHLQQRHNELQSHCDEQEKALAELGSQLSQSKLKVEDLKEAQLLTKDAQWAEDREVTNCKQCNKVFSVSRRRHHCRNCGDIFCNECSNVKMLLPSSSKPVRVCDTCNTMLLQRCSAN
jgi:ribosomal protein S27E